MKTNITMKSEKDRELFGVVIKQETKTGFMSLTDLAGSIYAWKGVEWLER